MVFEIAPKNPSDGRVRVAGTTDDGALGGEEGWNTVKVPTATLDSFVESGEVDLASVGLLWIDAQGHEGQIIAGAKALMAKPVPLVIEFWPYGLRRSGGLEELVNTISSTYTKLLDLGKDFPEAPRPAADIARLADKYWGVAQTDLLLIP